jgi:hypothetical protein
MFSGAHGAFIARLLSLDEKSLDPLEPLVHL